MTSKQPTEKDYVYTAFEAMWRTEINLVLYEDLYNEKEEKGFDDKSLAKEQDFFKETLLMTRARTENALTLARSGKIDRFPEALTYLKLIDISIEMACEYFEEERNIPNAIKIAQSSFSKHSKELDVLAVRMDEFCGSCISYPDENKMSVQDKGRMKKVISAIIDENGKGIKIQGDAIVYKVNELEEEFWDSKEGATLFKSASLRKTYIPQLKLHYDLKTDGSAGGYYFEDFLRVPQKES